MYTLELDDELERKTEEDSFENHSHIQRVRRNS